VTTIEKEHAREKDHHLKAQKAAREGTGTTIKGCEVTPYFGDASRFLTLAHWPSAGHSAVSKQEEAPRREAAGRHLQLDRKAEWQSVPPVKKVNPASIAKAAGDDGRQVKGSSTSADAALPLLQNKIGKIPAGSNSGPMSPTVLKVLPVIHPRQYSNPPHRPEPLKVNKLKDLTTTHRSELVSPMATPQKARAPLLEMFIRDILPRR